jgi:hypothetical protein
VCGERVAAKREEKLGSENSSSSIKAWEIGEFGSSDVEHAVVVWRWGWGVAVSAGGFEAAFFVPK